MEFRAPTGALLGLVPRTLSSYRGLWGPKSRDDNAGIWKLQGGGRKWMSWTGPWLLSLTSSLYNSSQLCGTPITMEPLQKAVPPEPTTSGRILYKLKLSLHHELVIVSNHFGWEKIVDAFPSFLKKRILNRTDTLEDNPSLLLCLVVIWWCPWFCLGRYGSLFLHQTAPNSQACGIYQADFMCIPLFLLNVFTMKLYYYETGRCLLHLLCIPSELLPIYLCWQMKSLAL